MTVIQKRKHASVVTPPGKDLGNAKKVKTYSDTDASLAKIFEALANEEKSVRLNAALDLFKFRESHQLEKEKLDYIVVRLIRGLCSSRKAARAGFFVALAEVIEDSFKGKGTSATSQSDIAQLLNLAEKNTSPDGHSNAQEKRNCLIGRVSAYHAIIHSGILLSATDHVIAEVLEALWRASASTSWLREEYGSICCEAIRAFSAKESSTLFAQKLVDNVSEKGIWRTPEGVAIWLEVSKHFPTVKLPRHAWEKQNPLDHSEEQSLAKILRSQQAEPSTNSDSTNKNISGSRQDAPHFVWNILLDRFMSAGRRSETLFRRFWDISVDKSFFAPSASAERKCLGFQLVSKSIADCPSWAIDCILSQNAIKCFVNQSSQPDRYLHGAAKALLSSIIAHANITPNSVLPILHALIEKGDIDFDRLSKTKTVHTILVNASADNLEQILGYYRRLILKPPIADDIRVGKLRQSIADQITAVLRCRIPAELSTFPSLKWLNIILKLFTEAGYLTSRFFGGGKPTLEFSKGNQEMFRSRLMSCLAQLLSRPSDSALACLSTVTDILGSIGLMNIVTLEKADDDVQRLVEEGRDHLRKLSEAQQQSQSHKALILLYSMALLLGYSGDPDAISMLEELRDCVQDVMHRTISPSSSAELNSQKEPEAENMALDLANENDIASNDKIDAIFESLLSFAARPSALCRKVAEQVFSSVAGLLTPMSLQSMLRVLEQKESSSGQNALFEAENEASTDSGDDSMSESADSSVADSEDDDVEIIKTDKSREDGDGNISNTEESSDGGVDDDDDDEEMRKFNSLLAQTLGTSISTNAESQSAAAEDSSDESSMDDEKMLALDSKLSEIFREKAVHGKLDSMKTKKKEQRDAKQNVINFKNRVLDLLQIFVKNQHKNILVIYLIMPLLRLIRETSAKQIAEKTFALLKALCDTARNKGLPQGASSNLIYEQLISLHEEALQPLASKMHAAAASRCSLFLARCYIDNCSNEDLETTTRPPAKGMKASKSKDRKVNIRVEPLKSKNEWSMLTRLYGNTHMRVLQGEGRLPHAFFVDWIQWSITQTQSLRPI